MQPRREFTYRFRVVDACNMCGAATSEAKLLGRRLSTSQGVRPTRTPGIAITVWRCRQCGLVFSNPMPIPGDVSEHYGRPPEDYWQAGYFEPSAGYFDAQIETFLRLWKGDSSPTALDIGAGLGKAMVALSRRGIDAYGLEPSTAFVDRAIEIGNATSDRLQASTVEDADYPTGQFDFVTFGAVLEHLYSPADAIEKALKWAAPRGLVHIEVPSSQWLTSRLANLLYRAQGLDYVANISPMHVPFHLYEFTLDSFDMHAKLVGYSVVEHRRYVGDTYLPAPLDRIGRRLMQVTGTGMQLEVWLAKEAA
jgi:2-polyprenyl-3-methyl-5-hydroxy-6-metoxy-1,4-benzoquinol methylase